MQTYTKARAIEVDPDFDAERDATRAGLDLDALDEPMVPLVRDLNRLPHAFTLQCCFGHFVGEGETDTHTLAPPPPTGRKTMEYRIAYVAFCVRGDERGQAFVEAVRGLRELDPKYIQVGSADWFWNRRVNSFVIQVGPKRGRKRDTMPLDGKEIRHVSHVRTQLWRRFATLVQQEFEAR